MRKIIKLLNGPFIPSLNMQLPIASLTYNLYNPINLSNFPSTPSLPNRNFYEPGSLKWKLENIKLMEKTVLDDWKRSNLEFKERLTNPSLSLFNNKTSFFQSKAGQALTQAGIDAISSSLASKFSNEVLGDSELGRGLGTLFSSGISSAGNTISNNIIKGKALTEGLGKNAGASLAGAGAGLAANYIGLGINALGGDSMLSRGIGQGVATGLGTLGGTLASNLVSGAGSKLAFGGTGLFSDMSKMKGAINPYALGATVLGSALGASMGPSKEYAGKYGNITQTMDTAYDLATAGVNFVPGIGQGLSAAMVLNKGLSNIFGSTDGMCVCAGTKVYTASGEVINIEDLVQNLGIIGWNENTHEVRPNTIKGIVEPRQKECLEIELKNGIILRCSIDHPILSNNKPKAETHRINGKRIAYRDWEFRRADELKVGDFVGLANNIDYWGTEEMPNAYLVGMLIGDGTYTYESSCRLCSVDPSTWKYIEENNLGVINNCSGTDPNKYSTEYRTYRIINGMQLMKDLGIAYLSGTSKTFPKNLGKYNKDSICKMIAGLYDTDGSISVNEEKGTYKITFYLSNLNLLYDLRNLLHKLGIFSTIYTRKASVNKLANGKIINSNLSYRLEITDMYSANNFYKNIPLNIDYKREHLEKIHQMLLNKKPLEHNEFSGAKLYKIISIKPIGILTVYNLEATEDHTYIANGIITHNTKTDAILGSAFMPAPVKWLNMWGSSKTGTFNNQSWLNSEKANSFMGDAFGNLNDRFDLARTEAGKTYGTFSQGAKRRAQENIDFANYAWNKILNMADLNEIQNIRSLAMSSINNLRYALMIQGGFKPLAIGKRGMKIFNNATNHNIGMRLLSAAALIDNKSMILSAQGGTKVTRPPRMRAHRKGDESRGLTPEEQEWWRLHEEEQKRLLEENTAKKIKEKEEAADKFDQQVNTVMGAMTLQANETPFTGLEYQQAAENLRLEKVEKFHEAEKIGEAALMADLAVSAAPLLQRGFRWVFNKAGLLVKVPILKTTQLKSGITKSVLDNGKIRLSLPSHTDNKPRQFVLEPARDAGDNKYYVHMRMWDDIENKIPASNVTNEEKQQLFDALYDELPEGAEILFPKSGLGNYGTRGTIAGLQRLSRDPRFTPGTKGTLQYLDKDGKTVRTYEGTSFIKTGLLDKVPVQKTVLETSSIIKPIIKKGYVTSPKDITSDVGDLIAEGSERSVYASKSNPNIVYKIEDGNAALEDINNIKIRSELTDDVIAPETTIGYFKHKNGKYYRVTQLDKYKSFNPDNYDTDLTPELNLEIINTLEKAGWKVNIKNGLAVTASKNGITIGNLEHFNWGRDSKGNLKLIDLYVVNDSKLQASLESDFKGKPVILSVPKTMRKADSDVAKMNEYHTANVLEYNQSTGNNITSIPFRTDYNGRLIRVLPNEEFNTVVQSKNTNAPSGNELNIGGMYSKNDDTVYLRNTGNPSNNYHEFLHSSHYGETNPEVTQWRILQLIDEDKVSKMTPQQKAYYISVKETPVHLRLQGEHMNIKVGDPYPGDEAFDKMINEHGIGGAAYYMKRDTSEAKQLLWKAFNGTLFSGLTAVTLYNKSK